MTNSDLKIFNENTVMNAYRELKKDKDFRLMSKNIKAARIVLASDVCFEKVRRILKENNVEL